MGVNSNGSRISFVAHACRLTLTSEIRKVLANVLAHLRLVWDELDVVTWSNIGVMKLMFLAEDLQDAGGAEQWNPQSPHCIEAA
jgi:hypothetical protein